MIEDIGNLFHGFSVVLQPYNIVLMVLGIVLGGTGFVFRQEADRLPTKMLTTALFAGSSIIAPFFLGTAVGAVATGGVRVGDSGNDPTPWTKAGPRVTCR